jgi:hypothetical protein
MKSSNIGKRKPCQQRGGARVAQRLCGGGDRPLIEHIRPGYGYRGDDKEKSKNFASDFLKANGIIWNGSSRLGYWKS